MFSKQLKSRNDDSLPPSAGALAARDLVGRQSFIEVKQPIPLDNLQPVETQPGTGSTDADPRGEFKQRPMARTDQMPLVVGQEVIREGLERNELMRTTIDIGVRTAVLADDDDVQFGFSFAKYDIESSGIGKIRPAAKKLQLTYLRRGR
jgi:hypothetical protein